MRLELIKKLEENIGTLDAKPFQDILQGAGVDDFIFEKNGIRIPKSTINDLDHFCNQLKNASRAGREYKIDLDEVKDEVFVHTNYYPSFSHTGTPAVSDSWRKLSWGVLPEQQILPDFSPQFHHPIKVLDVGAGNGTNAQRMRDEFKYDVYALEPSFVSESDFKECQRKLGEDKVAKMTLQDAIRKQPTKYLNSFDAVTVFKYGVDIQNKDLFMQALSKVIKLDGVIYITCVEPYKMRKQVHYENSYLLDKLREYFRAVETHFTPTEGIIVCKQPLRPEAVLARLPTIFISSTILTPAENKERPMVEAINKVKKLVSV